MVMAMMDMIEGIKNIYTASFAFDKMSSVCPLSVVKCSAHHTSVHPATALALSCLSHFL